MGGNQGYKIELKRNQRKKKKEKRKRVLNDSSGATPHCTTGFDVSSAVSSRLFSLGFSINRNSWNET